MNPDTKQYFNGRVVGKKKLTPNVGRGESSDAPIVGERGFKRPKVIRGGKRSANKKKELGKQVLEYYQLPKKPGRQNGGGAQGEKADELK